MSTQVQLRRGNTSQHSTFTGANGEVTVNTDQYTLVVHDGTTAGGFAVAPKNNPTFTGNVSLGNVSVSSDKISVGNSSVNTQIVAGNVYLNGSTLVVGNTASNVTINSSSISVGAITINSSAFSGDAATVGGNTALDLRTYADNKASNAYSNAISYADGRIIDSVTNTSTAYAASANSVKNAYDRAIDANTRAASAQTEASNAYTNATNFAANASNISSGTVNEARLPYRMNQNVRTSDTVEFAGITLTGNLVVSGNVNIIGANNLSLTDNMIYLNSNSTTANPDLGISGNYNDGTYRHTGFFRDATDGKWKVFDNYEPEPDASVYIDTSNGTFHLADFQANQVFVGNTTVYATLNATSFNGTSNNSLYLGGNSASDLQTYADNKAANAYSNAIAYSGNSAAAYTNAVAYVDGKSFVNTSQLSSNLGNYQTTAGLSANVATLTSNNASFLGGTAAANFVQNTDSRTLSGNLVLSGANNTVSGNLTIASTGELIITNGAGIIANGTLGTSGQVLTTNGTSVYWTGASAGFTNGTSISVNNFVLTGAFSANSSNGSPGQFLVSNNAGAYWANAIMLDVYYSNGTLAFSGSGAPAPTIVNFTDSIVASFMLGL